jgi:hypothetical protein
VQWLNGRHFFWPVYLGDVTSWLDRSRHDHSWRWSVNFSTVSPNKHSSVSGPRESASFRSFFASDLWSLNRCSIAPGKHGRRAFHWGMPIRFWMCPFAHRKIGTSFIKDPATVYVDTALPIQCIDSMAETGLRRFFEGNNHLIDLWYRENPKSSNWTLLEESGNKYREGSVFTSWFHNRWTRHQARRPLQ